MSDKRFELNDQNLPIIELIGEHMPGGFFIYKASGDEELLYVNKAVLQIYGCESMEEFKALTGYTFRGMLYPEDYKAVSESIVDQIEQNDDNMDYVVYRIVRKDGAIRWVDDYGHFTMTEQYGGLYYVFISDITEKRERMESDDAMRKAVIEALSESYHTVWLINDVESESFSLYRGDIEGDSAHAMPNREALKSLKYSDARDYYIRTTVAASDRERLRKELELSNIVRRISEKHQYTVNYLRTMSDGSERYFRIEFAKVNMPDGRTGVVCGFKDVDEDVRNGQAMQKALQNARKTEEENRRLTEEIASAEKLAKMMASIGTLLTNMPAMSYSKDAETGKYLACNATFADYAHKNSPEEVVGLTDYEIFDPVTAAHFVEDDRKALAMDDPYIFFEDVPDAAGFPKSFQTTKMRFTDPSGRMCTLGMCVDVTEMSRIKAAEAEARVKQQEMEEKLALQERLLQQEKMQDQQHKMITALASDYWSVYYLELDINHGICYQSHSDLENGFKVGEEFPYIEAVTAYAKTYITEQYLDDFLSFVQPDAIRAGLAKERVISFRYKVRRHGVESYEMVRFAGVRHPEDREDGLVHNVGACFIDVDAETRRDMEQSMALQDALKAAEEASRAKTTFLSNMSHEIRTPMNAIIGLNNIALHDEKTPEKTREYLTKIDTSAHHLLNIINDILDMSRIESGRMYIKSEEFSFPKMLEQVNTIISGQCRDKGLHYDCRTKGRIDEYYIGDAMKLRQVMINILGNAVKFTPEGGSVSFTVEKMASYDRKDTLRLIFSDTGIGMSKEYLPHIFDAFSQEDASATNRYGSTGLGMPITKNIVELMNGSIEVESQKGVGSTFIVTLTLGHSDRKKDEDPLKTGTLMPHEMCVLVIDDDSIACEHAEIVLGQLGIICETAGSGYEGVEMVRIRHARREPYNLVLVDWKMPGMDGVETTRQIRSIVGNETPVIILTSYNWDDIAEEALEAGVDSFVPKPLFAATVLDEFREAFEKKNAANAVGRADLTGRRILLAEDMAVNAEIIMMILGLKDVEVEHAENGKVAVQLFGEHEAGYYDAILMDMRMPEMDGLTATELIRTMEKPDSISIPIIALTANAFDEDVQRSMQAGLNAHLSKPVEPDALFETLETLIQ